MRSSHAPVHAAITAKLRRRGEAFRITRDELLCWARDIEKLQSENTKLASVVERLNAANKNLRGRHNEH